MKTFTFGGEKGRRMNAYLGELDEAELWRILYRSPVFIFPSGSNSLSGLLN